MRAARDAGSLNSYWQAVRVGDVVVEHLDLGVAGNGRPVRHLQGYILIIVSYRHLHTSVRMPALSRNPLVGKQDGGPAIGLALFAQTAGSREGHMRTCNESLP